MFPQDYFKTLETFVNQDREENLRFIFKLFDVFNEDKITEAGLFKFMEDASIRRTDTAANQCNILNLNETEHDIFLEIFTNTYAKIVDALSRKVKMSSMRSGIDMSSSFIMKSGNQRRNNALPQMSN